MGSPSILMLPDGDYIASVDLNSWDMERLEDEFTMIFRSADKGKTWEMISKIKTQHWASLFFGKTKTDSNLTFYGWSGKAKRA